MRILAFFQSTQQKIWLQFKSLTGFKALCRDNPEQNAKTIHVSNPEHLPICKAPHGDNLEQNAETVHASNLEHLLVFKALRRDDL